ASAASRASWRGTLLAHLNRYKRFPGGANPGTVQVSFSIDRSGRVLTARLVRGSGDALLDEEAVAMIRRASPVPAPPEGLGGGTIALAVPVKFSR
ncbi:MAG: energy transducer TonB, partial [Bosea sp. (in: a-proteobacteria)]|nr:energy transducer TonB [Bosea sp. (in: a-proteobacteria)]